MSLHPQTIRIRHRLAEWKKQGRKHWDLYRWVMDPHVLHDALQLVLKNRGSPGIDGQRCEAIRGREWEYATRRPRICASEAIIRQPCAGSIFLRRWEEAALGDTQDTGSSSAAGVSAAAGADIRASLHGLLVRVSAGQERSGVRKSRSGGDVYEAIRAGGRDPKASSVRQAQPGASGVRLPFQQEEKPPHWRSSLGLMEVTTWAKRRQSEFRAVMQMK